MSCLFNSFSRLLDIPTDTIRQTICDYLAKDGIIMDDMATVDVLAFDRENYIEHMRCSHTWGGAIEIQAAAMIWKARIIVENHRDGGGKVIEFVPIAPVVAELEMRIYWTGGHYEPISKTAICSA
jgi:hypothetical protein